MAMSKDEQKKSEEKAPVGVLEMWGPEIGRESLDNVDNIVEVGGGWLSSAITAVRGAVNLSFAIHYKKKEHEWMPKEEIFKENDYSLRDAMVLTEEEREAHDNLPPVKHKLCDDEVVDGSLYQLLDVAPGAGAIEVTKAYRGKSLQYNPDFNQTPEAQKIYDELCEAYQILVDDTLRDLYHAKGYKAVEGLVTKVDPTKFMDLTFGAAKFETYIGDVGASDKFKMVKSGDFGASLLATASSATADSKDEDHALREFPQREREVLVAGRLAAHLDEINTKLADERAGFINIGTEDPNSSKDPSCIATLASEANLLVQQTRGRELLYLIGRVYTIKSLQLIENKAALLGELWSKGRTKKSFGRHALKTWVEQDSKATGFLAGVDDQKKDAQRLDRYSSLWNASVNDIETTLLSVCNLVLLDVDNPKSCYSPTNGGKSIHRERAIALHLIGVIFTLTAEHTPSEGYDAKQNLSMIRHKLMEMVESDKSTFPMELAMAADRESEGEDESWTKN